MYKTPDIVVLSDAHLGTYGCHAPQLLQYLRSIRPKYLIINGDFIDAWQFRKRYFPKDHLEVIQEVIKMSLSEVKVYYITGNHDDLLRRFSPLSLGNIHLRDKLILHLEDKSYWFFHGDVFDASLLVSPALATMGGKGYDWLIRFNRFVNKMRQRLGMRRKSFTHKIKHSVKRAVKYIVDFEETAIQLAAKQNYDYVICGHIHRPQIRTVDVEGTPVCYMNSGDWVENLSSLEYNHGKWSIYRYDEAEYDILNSKLRPKELKKSRKYLKPNWFEDQVFHSILRQTRFRDE